MSEKNAIIINDVTKSYRLYKSQWQQVLDAFGFAKKQQIQEFHALKNVNLNIQKGERIGIVGRNGAGKTTLLKLITGNFQPTTGDIKIDGNVQALMSTGLGFHPEFSGLENIRASLMYNGLSKRELETAVEEITDFVELGDFLEQPLKTYSLGMQSRLYFAVATAIHPEILIVDEVLGAGDSYFSAKSADRMKKLTNSGCTLLLVSHATAQVLQFCEKAIWLECGEVVMEGAAIEVVKAYEEYSKKLELESEESLKNTQTQTKPASVIQSKWLREKLLNEVMSQHGRPINRNQDSKNISRWPSHEEGLKINHIRVLGPNEQEVYHLNTGDRTSIEIEVLAEKTSNYDIYFVILLFTEDGRWLSRHCSDKYNVDLREGELKKIQLTYDSILLGNGKYIFSAAIYKIFDIKDLSTARYYDLLSRSFEIEVSAPTKDDSTLFYHPSEWKLLPSDEKTSEDVVVANEA
jgi:homopolymeric O-antigen transport system ATP-binding protein